MVLSESVSGDESDEEDDEEDGKLERELFCFECISPLVDFDLDDAMMATSSPTKTGSKAPEPERFPVSSAGLPSIVPSIVNICLGS